MKQYLRLGGINFYVIPSNFFQSYTSMRYFKIQAISGVTYTVCTSRTLILPYRDGTSNQDCSQTTQNSFSYDMSDLCTNYGSLWDCPPLYVSVQAQTFADPSQVACQLASCAAPDQSEFMIIVNNLGCSKGTKIVYSLAVVILGLVGMLA